MYMKEYIGCKQKTDKEMNFSCPCESHSNAKCTASNAHCIKEIQLHSGRQKMIVSSGR